MLKEFTRRGSKSNLLTLFLKPESQSEIVSLDFLGFFLSNSLLRITLIKPLGFHLP